MEKLRLDQYIRYALSGAVALIALVLVYPQTRFLLTANNRLFQASIVLVLILLIGISLYSFHRSILYPIIERLILNKIYGWHLKFCDYFWWRYPPVLIILDRKRVFLRSKKENPLKPLSEWFARIHFYYCSAWGILFALLIGYKLNPCGSVSWKTFVFPAIIIIIILIFAFFDDCRAMRLERRILKKKISSIRFE